MASRDIKKLDPVRRFILERTKERGSDLKALSVALGRNITYMDAFIWKGSPAKLDGDDRARLAELLDAPDEALRTGRVSSSAATVEKVRNVEYARLPAYDIRASAGKGSLVEDGEPIGWRLFELGWLKSVSPSQLELLRVIQVAGDSMTDTLANGDHVLVDLGRRTLAQPGIFVLRLDGELIIKRVQKSFGTGAVTLISDNQRYPLETIDTPDRLDVIGRVVWLGRSVG